jgi:ketosteroid isomerase-like protein
MGEGTYHSAGGPKALIQALYERLNRLDFDGARHLITADYVDHMSNLRGLCGEEALAALFELVRRSFSGFHVTADDIIAEGDRVAVRWTVRTTNQAAPAVAHLNGGTTMMGISVYRVAGGRIAERWVALSM